MKDRGKTNYQRDDVDPYKDYTSQVVSNLVSKSGSEDECVKLKFSTQLQDVLATISKVNNGDRLPIILDKTKVLNVYNKDGKICGKIIAPLMTNLVHCIEKGNSFVAVVMNISELICNVQVEIV